MRHLATQGIEASGNCEPVEDKSTPKSPEPLAELKPRKVSGKLDSELVHACWPRSGLADQPAEPRT